MVRLLRGFEGQASYPRIMAAGVAYVLIRVLPLVGAVGGIYVGSDLKLANVVLGACLSLGLASLSTFFSRSAPWRTIIANRVFTYEEPNPRTMVEFLIHDADFSVAYRALRRAHFIPLYGASVGRPPEDATDLTARIGVQEPEAYLQSTSDDDRIMRIATVLGGVGIRARVASIDAFPDGRVERRSTDQPAVTSSWAG
jgi:hypothetical protein